MILSASRRTDLPALYGEWMVNRLKAGSVLAPNPYRAGHASHIRFSPDTVDCIVFWTKNPIPFESYWRQVERLGYRDYYVEYTLTALEELEPGLPPLEKRVEAFLRLSARLGPKRVDWRFDPILLGGERTPEWHGERFERLCRKLAGRTERCIFSFADHYAHHGKLFREAERAEVVRTARLLADIAGAYGLPLLTCAEQADLSACGIGHAACIDREKIHQITGAELRAKKDPGQRPACGCMESVDIGAYNTCVNGCAYCYATRSRSTAQRNFQAHDPASPILMGASPETLTVSEKNPPSLKTGQISLF